MLVVGEAAPVLGTALLRLSEGPATDWIVVELRAVRGRGARGAVVHLAFADGCCDSFFRAAMPGTALDGPGIRFDSEEYDTRHWR